jgi:hypothetical protein
MILSNQLSQNDLSLFHKKREISGTLEIKSHYCLLFLFELER